MSWKHGIWLLGDVETTGLRFGESRITEIALMVVNNLTPVMEFSTLLNPECMIPSKITEITGISNEMAVGKPVFEDIATNLEKVINKALVFIAYNANFDKGHIEAELNRYGKSFRVPYVLDPLIWVRHFDGSGKNKLTEVAKRYEVEVDGTAHRALVDVKLLLGVTKCFLTKLPDDIKSLVYLQHMWRRQQDEARRKKRGSKRR